MNRPRWRYVTDWVRRLWLGPAPDDLDLSGDWFGTYCYPQSNGQFPFVITLTEQQSRLSGQCEEVNTFGDPDASHLFATLAGQRDGWQLSFLKTYDGRGGVTHDVYYEGWLDRAGREIRGFWTAGLVPGEVSWGSTFTMVRQPVANDP